MVKDEATIEGILAQMEDTDLVDYVYNVAKSEAMCRNQRQMAEHELQQRMEARGATEVPHPTLSCKLEYPSPVYDSGKLRRLGELLPPETVSTACIPQHEETIVVQEKWDARIFRNWGKKFGFEVGQVIEDAKAPGGPPRLRVTEKKP